LVSALSVLTEKKYFLVDIDYIRQLRKLVDLPILQKDFFIDAYQIYEAAVLGADCILLIASILSKEELLNFISIAKENNLSALVEVHNEQDLDKALECKAEIIGINNRNLETFKVNIETSLKLLPLIPSGLNIIKVSESGLNTFEDLIRLKDAGVDAVLIGEGFMTCDNIKDKINALRGIQ
jgi:indole-3-glycerol phosphate synthase